jgi:hypothetical protein
VSPVVDKRRMADVIRALAVGVDPRLPGWQVQALDAVGQRFEETGDPMAPWSALQFARSHSIPVPEWVLDYLEGRAGQLDKIAVDGGGGKREAEAIGRALGFGAIGRGQTAAASASATATREFTLALGMAMEVRLGAGKSKAATIVAAAMNSSASSVERAYAREGQRADQVLDGILEVYEVQQ